MTPMTKEEAKRKYDEAVQNRNWARNRRDAAQAERNKRESAYDQQKKLKKAKEDRRDSLNRIIRFFDNSLSNQINATNKKAQNADSAYCSAIFCTEASAIPNASISDSFRTKSVFGDPDTSGAYSDCVNERNLANQAIATAESEMARLKKEYEHWHSEYKKYNNLTNDYQYQVNKYSRYL